MVVPILTPTDPESGVLGCAMLAGVGAGILTGSTTQSGDWSATIAEIQPDPKWSERYERMASFFNRVYLQSESYWNEIDTL